LKLEKKYTQKIDGVIISRKSKIAMTLQQ